MSHLSVCADGLSKMYRIRGPQAEYLTLRDSIASLASAPFRKLRSQFAVGKKPQSTGNYQDFWALQDISFEIHPGEVVGIIGRNGAGKSTLLKILSRITKPTRGTAEIRGRLGSLLEVGTGFHQELSGRENIYLNGAILGMKQYEIRRRFDEIVDFAEVEKFIDTPVKHYSSGMYLRLAFAVAAHLEPEVLMVDEVLAVGDARFQKKCLNKMDEVGRTGRTVLFVSHSMPSITRLCGRAILLDGGRVIEDGRSESVVSTYLHDGAIAKNEWTDPRTAPQGRQVRLCAVRIRNEDGEISDSHDIRREISVEMEFEVLEDGFVLMPHFHFSNDEGVHVFTTHDLDPQWRDRPRNAGRYLSRVWIPGNLLSEGTLFVNASMMALQPKSFQFSAEEVAAFQVVDSLDGDSARGDWAGHMKGAIRPLLKWETPVSPDCLQPAQK